VIVQEAIPQPKPTVNIAATEIPASAPVPADPTGLTWWRVITWLGALFGFVAVQQYSVPQSEADYWQRSDRRPRARRLVCEEGS
ncbi:MAG: hypothetical protein ACRCZF_25095, partial [Gemmataceae bacterium]